MISDRIDELIALAALGELSPDEQVELDLAAADDAEITAELDAALTAAAALQRTHSEPPPPSLRNSVLVAIASTPQDDTSDARSHHTDEPATAPQPPMPPPTMVTSLESHRTRLRLKPALLAAAAVALFAVGGVVIMATTDDTSDPIAAVVDAPDATSRSLSGEIANLTVVYSASEGALVIEGEAIPVLDNTVTYQLWLVGDDAATSVGVFRPNADGTVSERFADADPTNFVLGVTREPAGGSDSPTLPILASA